MKVKNKKSSKDQPEKEDIKKGEFYYTNADFKKDQAKIKVEVKYNIARQYFKDKTLYPRIKAMNDKFVKKALTMFNEARKLADIK